MSLFVGNISKNVRPFEIEDNFNKYGKCNIKQKGSYAFIEYDDDRDAEEAKENLHDVNMGGLNIAIEWSKRSGRFNAKDSHRPPPRRNSEIKCYNCDKPGHFARDCRN
jgi:arginine/serine-rich splicing factor 7